MVCQSQVQNYAVTQHVIEDDGHESNDYQEYFNFARTSLSIALPKNWEEVLSLKLMHVAVHCNIFY